MSTDVAIVPCSASDVVVPVNAERVREYLRNASARNTIRGYRSSFEQFERWCRAANLLPLPASGETIALYLAAQAERLKVATLVHHLTAIKKAHQAAGMQLVGMNNLLVAETLKGIKRTHGTAAKQKAALLTDDLRLILRTLSTSLTGTRNRALLLVGFAGAFRRSELVGIDVSDLKFEQAGLLITLRRSKTDQEGQGRHIAIPAGQNPTTCPVLAVRDWLAQADIVDGPCFVQYGKVERLRLPV